MYVKYLDMLLFSPIIAWTRLSMLLIFFFFYILIFLSRDNYTNKYFSITFYITGIVRRKVALISYLFSKHIPTCAKVLNNIFYSKKHLTTTSPESPLNSRLDLISKRDEIEHRSSFAMDTAIEKIVVCECKRWFGILILLLVSNGHYKPGRVESVKAAAVDFDARIRCKLNSAGVSEWNKVELMRAMDFDSRANYRALIRHSWTLQYAVH